ncbi:MAG: DUF2961 domain-containing protein [Bacteroidia bacterium]|nr:DUF2961 domain-containing protein [Bacteroidia bacterium]
MKIFKYLIIILIWHHSWIPAIPQSVTVSALLSEMTDLKTLAERPSPWYKQSQASSYDRKSQEGGESWFANSDVGQYVRTEVNDGRKEQVLADLTGPGAISRFWSANPDLKNAVRFYFDGEQEARLKVPLNELFTGRHPLFGPEFSYLGGTGGNLYFPIPYSTSLKITIEDGKGSLRLYYEIGYRTYENGTSVETFNPAMADSWQEERIRAGRGLTRPEAMVPAQGAQWKTTNLTIPPGESGLLPMIMGEQAVFSFSARVDQTEESSVWTDPKRAHVAWRHLLLQISFDGEPGIRSPLGDFFGSGPGINPYENLFFTVSANGWMTSRLLMPFQYSMRTEIFNAGTIPYTVELMTGSSPFTFTGKTYYLHAQWGTLPRASWPPFDVNFLHPTGEGKVVGTVYQISNPSYIWWGEGDALPFHSSIRFDQEIWHWMPCNPVWSHVIFWYAKPGSPGPLPVDRQSLMPMDLGIRENMLELIEGESLNFTATAGTAASERLANCSGARHLVWRNANPGDRIRVHFDVPVSGQYQMMVNLCMSPDYGKYRFRVNDQESQQIADAWSAKLFWVRPVLGQFTLKQGDNILEVSLLEPNPQAKSGNLFGLDYIFLTRMD